MPDQVFVYFNWLHSMAKKMIYRISGLDSAIELIRPGASYELTQNGFEIWNDPRPQPTIKELKEVQKKTREFEESLNPIFLKSQLESRGL